VYNSKIKDNKYFRGEYVSRINRVIDYIEMNLTQTLSLQEIATVANFSSYHFHRIFAAMIGETLNQFISRLRMEKTAILLIADINKSITEVMFDCGLSDSSSFARLFKKYTGKWLSTR